MMLLALAVFAGGSFAADVAARKLSLGVFPYAGVAATTVNAASIQLAPLTNANDPTFTVTSVTWKDMGGDAFTDNFLKGAKYVATIVLTASANNTFAASNTAATDFVTVTEWGGGTLGSIVKNTDNNVATITWTTDPISDAPTRVKATLLELTTPPYDGVSTNNVNENAVGFANYPVGAGTEPADFEVSGLTWTTRSGGDIPSDEFVVGVTYIGTFELSAKTNYSFVGFLDADVAGFLPGASVAKRTNTAVDPEEDIVYGVQNNGAKYTFWIERKIGYAPTTIAAAMDGRTLTLTKLPYSGVNANTITPATVALSELAAGKVAAFDVTGISFTDPQKVSATTFIKNVTYNGTVTLTARDGYTFENPLPNSGALTFENFITQTGITASMGTGQAPALVAPVGYGNGNKLELRFTYVVGDAPVVVIPAAITLETVPYHDVASSAVSGSVAKMTWPGLIATDSSFAVDAISWATPDGETFTGSFSTGSTYIATFTLIARKDASSPNLAFSFDGFNVASVGGFISGATNGKIVGAGAGNELTFTRLFAIPSAPVITGNDVTVQLASATATDVNLATAGLFTITGEAGPRTYTNESGPMSGAGTGTIAAGTSTLNVEEPGIFNIKLETGAGTNGQFVAADAAAQLTVLSSASPGVTISTQPVSKTIVADYPRDSLKVVAAGVNLNAATHTITYQWYRGTNNAKSNWVTANKVTAPSATKSGLLISDIAASLPAAGEQASFYCVLGVKAGDNNVPIVDRVTNVVTVSVRTADASAAPAVASLTFADGSAAFTNGGEFKITNPSVVITTANAAVAGVAANWKLVRLDYAHTSNPEANVSNYDMGAALTAADIKGVRAVGTYNVTAVMKNVTEGTVGYGLYLEKVATFTVGKRNLSAVTMTVTPFSAADAVYDGTVKAVKTRVTVKDGTGASAVDLEEGRDFSYAAGLDWKNAGTAAVKIEATPNGNYTGELTKTIAITKKAVKVRVGAAYTFSKAYDGTVAVDTGTAWANWAEAIVFDSVVSGESFTREDFVVRDLKYADAAAGENKSVTATVSLRADSVSVARNYSLASGAITFSKQVITRRVPSAELFTATYGTPAKPFLLTGDNNLLYNGAARPVSVDWVSAVKSSGGKITVLYNGDTTRANVKASGSYAVTLNVTAGTSLDSASGIALGTLTIADALPPVIDPATPADTSYYALGSVTLKVSAVNPKDEKSTGLSYQWYEVKDGENVVLKSADAKSASLVVKDTVVGQHTYIVKVTYGGSGTEQDTSSAMSRPVNVTVNPAPKSIKGAVIVAAPVQPYIYNGTKLVPTAEDFTVTVGGQTLQPNSDYRVKSADNNTNAGSGARVVLEGVNNYKETENGTFTIAKRPVTVEDLAALAYVADYNGQTQEIKVSAKTGLSGLGAVTRNYTPDSVSRDNAGTWDVTLSFAEGSNFEPRESLPLEQPYTIRKVALSASMLNYAALPKNVAWTGENQGIAAPTYKGLGTSYTGTLDVVYVKGNEEPSAIAVDSGTYSVVAKVGGDRNFFEGEITLGRIVIHGEGWIDAVAEGNREVPVSGGTVEAAVAPVSSPVASVAAGPSPVRAGEKLSFFWSGAKPVKGKLSVFSGLGEKVATVSVSGTGKIGEWNVTGGTEGTYVVRGVLTDKDGVRVKVSTLVSVVR
jgi:hypothetical protein